MSEERMHGPERLRVYWLTLEFAKRCDRLSKLVAGKPIALQLVRASESGVLNISEAVGHFTPGKKIYHLRLALGSIDECSGAINRIAQLRPDADVSDLRRTASMICKMLLALIRRFETQ